MNKTLIAIALSAALLGTTSTTTAASTNKKEAMEGLSLWCADYPGASGLDELLKDFKKSNQEFYKRIKFLMWQGSRGDADAACKAGRDKAVAQEEADAEWRRQRDAAQDVEIVIGSPESIIELKHGSSDLYSETVTAAGTTGIYIYKSMTFRVANGVVTAISTHR